MNLGGRAGRLVSPWFVGPNLWGALVCGGARLVGEPPLLDHVAGLALVHLSSDCFTAIFLFGSQAPSPHTQTMNRVRGPSVFRLFHGWLFDWLTGSISTNSNNAQSFNVSPNCDTPAL